jgi:glycolate oxidase FAD binding subunit
VGLLQLISSDAAALVKTVAELRANRVGSGGSLVILRATPQVKASLDVWGDVGDALPVMRRIKEHFDPKQILSPGRFVGGI